MEKVSLNNQFYFLKNAMKILLPVSVFSLVFSQSYSLCPSLLHSFHELFSYFSIQVFTYSSERNCIFLLCNGILVFIIKNSGLISTTNISDQESHKEFNSTESKNQETKTEFLEKVVEIENQEKVEEETEILSQSDLVSVGTIDVKEDQESYVQIIEELEEEEEEEETLEEEEEETLEELHKKCDDFIKRIKKEIIRG
ncbi:uncharacterized protein LOC129892060 [Solanum dulcamara]|uniref:uncharacterized protein LOC129892060 n=1 Tax=Solanum dulcamara TaxID=45834 RepID=UPI002485AA1A|nr:uncharacterized protein LOC129892060 [Solanum dulcamara]